jgi:hypothetical protein
VARVSENLSVLSAMSFASLKGDWDSLPDAEGSAALRSGSEGAVFETEGAITLGGTRAESCGIGLGALERFCSRRVPLDWAACWAACWAGLPGRKRRLRCFLRVMFRGGSGDGTKPRHGQLTFGRHGPLSRG